ncbi:MAG TPA: glycosyltransferase, partial [Candidatus Atribacteria bacterium]|nr:glycosyltransferase [Candidatus Atribacteria bacterium]
YKEAKSLVNNGYDVTVLAWDRECKYPKKEVIDGIKIERIRLKARYGFSIELLLKMHLFWVQSLFKALKKDFDIIHAHDFDMILVGILLKIIKRKRLVYDSHEIYAEMKHPFLIRYLTIFLEFVCMFFVDVLICTNKERLQLIEHRYRVKKSIILENYPQLKKNFPIQKYRTKYRKEFNIDNKIVFVYIGFLNENRGIEESINILSKSKFRDDIRLLLIGEGAIKEKIIKIAKANNFSQNLKLIGWVPMTTVDKYLCVADFGLYFIKDSCLNNHYASPNKIYDYLSCKVVPLATNLPILRKILKNERIGILLDLSKFTDSIKKIDQLISNKEKIEKLKERGYHVYLNEYNWENIENKILNVYEGLK